MLNKKVCRRCIDLRYRGTLCVWQANDDAEWGRGVVLCGAGVTPRGLRFIKIDEPPPDHCPYIVEHVVSQDAE